MRRISRNLSLVLVALAAFAILGAASASASMFRSPEGGTTVWSGATTNSHTLSMPGTHTSSACENNISATTLGSEIPWLNMIHRDKEGKAVLKCASSGLAYFWNMGACEFQFWPGGESLIGRMDLVGCEKGPLWSEALGCKITIGNQKNMGPVKFENSLSGGIPVIKAIANLSSIDYTKSGSCPGGTGFRTDGTYTGEWILSGASTGGLTKSVFVEASPEPEPPVLPPAFEVEEIPAKVSGAKIANAVFYFDYEALLCQTQAFPMDVVNTVSTEVLTVYPTYKECTYSQPVKNVFTKLPDNFVSMGGCRYKVYATGKFEITGTNCAKEPIFVTAPGCVLEIGPQSGLSATLTNEGVGRDRSVKVVGKKPPESPLTYTAMGPGCEKKGTFNTGTLANGFNVSASNGGIFRR